MGRFFNTAGPCDPVLHYMVPPEPRLPEVRPLVERNLYAVLHAPRQSGKTTTLRALAQSMTASGRWAALHFSCQPAQAAGDDYGNTEDIILDTLAEDAEALPTELRPPLPWRQAPAGKRLTAGLRAWARACPRPLALFFDEIDAVRDASLVSVLSQLRAGYDKRPTDFPAAVVLCGLRDVRDYKAASGGDAGRLGSASPFNIKAESLRLGDFTFADVRALYAQHTAETGQSFTDEALARVWEYTRGQPWLVNALAAEIIDKIKVPLDERVTVDHIDQAKDRLIVARATHLDSLLARLHEERVRRVLEPLIVGDLPPADDTFDDDLSYARDLGLLAVNRPVRVANPIYREVILRVLATRTAEVVTAEPRSFVGADRRLDFDKLLAEFAQFWKENGQVLAARDAYHEAAPQLVLMGFFHRLVNGGGFIDREYGIGMRRIDMLIRWPYLDARGRRALQREAIELKVWRKGDADPLPAGLAQFDDYLAGLSLDHGTLIIFDRRPEAAPITERTRFSTAHTPSGRAVILLRA